MRSCSTNGFEGGVSEENKCDDVLEGGMIGEGSKSMIFLILVGN